MAVVSGLSRWSGERAKPSAPGDDAYLSIVNGYRAQAGLAPVDANPAWEEGNRKHARYMVENDVIQHFEDPGNPWYTAEGDAAATSSNLVGGGAGPGSNAAFAIKLWMQAPFHAVGILDPRLQTTGYGEYFDASSPGISWGAGLDVIRGLGSAPPGVTYPIVWPGDQTMVAIREHSGESPSPLTSCPGYQSPSGLPLVVQFAGTPNVTEHSFSVGGVALAHCVFDETNYENPDPSEESLGRAILSSRNAVVLIPEEPLDAGETYSASLTSNGEALDWSFSIGPAVTVSVTKGGTGSGHVRSLEYPEPEIDCGTSCAAKYLVEDWVSLLAEPDPGSVFSGWSSGCSGTSFCEPELTEDVEIVAEFTSKAAVVRHAVDVDLKLEGHLKAVVSIDSPSQSACATGSEIRLQRWSRGKWQRLAKRPPPHDNKVQFSLKDRQGRYRVKTSRFWLDDSNRCLAADSASRAHRHNVVGHG